MELIANTMNGAWPADLVRRADVEALTQIDLAVAYVTKMDAIFELAQTRDVPLNLYALADGEGFPNLTVARKFVEGGSTTRRLFLTRGFFHPKVLWFRGVGAYVGSANLTNAAWWQNLECGVWLSQADLDRTNWNEELASIFAVVHDHCREATIEDISALEELARLRGPLRAEKQRYQKHLDRLLAKLPGAHSPIDQTRRREPGGAAKKAFVRDWREGLTVLRKIAALLEDRRDQWPSWVERDVPGAIVQDQVTEWWWNNEFRKSGRSRREMVKAHARNSSDPQKTVLRVFEDWCQFDPGPGDKDWAPYINEYPRELRALLSRQQLESLDLEGLERVLWLCHAAREHGRQVKNVDFGLAPGEKRKHRERIGLYAKYLDAQRSAAGRGVREVLSFVLWGDQLGIRGGQHAEDRIWAASKDPAWKLPHLGSAIFGELLGYARPDDFPPRNNRVSKSLFALGYQGIRYY